MSSTTISSREFYQRTGKAKRATKNGPVYITERGRPSHVLLTIEEYRKITGRGKSLVEALGMPPGVEDVELDIPPRDEFSLRIPDLS